MSEMNPPPKIPKWMLNAQIFVLRRQWVKPFNKQVMIITTTGRKSGKHFTVPISYVRDGSTLYGFTIGGTSNWYKNALTATPVTLEVQGKKITAKAEPVQSQSDLENVIKIYQRDQPSTFPRFFKVPADAPMEDLLKIADRIKFVRFNPA